MAGRPGRRLAIQVTFLASLLVFLAYYFYLIPSRPEHTDRVLGYLYAIAAHGPPVYVSIIDLSILVASAAVAVTSFFTATVLRNRGTW